MSAYSRTHDPEPDQCGVRADNRRQDLLCDRRDHRQDDEGDFKEVQKERQEKDEQVDEDQESPDAAGQGRKHMLEPDAARDAQEHHGETGRAIRMNTTMVVIRMVVS